MRDFTDVEFDILGTIYFVEPFDKIAEEVHCPENIVADSLKFLIDHKFVSPMRWDEGKREYIRSFIYDSDNMRAYHYLITKEGLIAHNGR
jgi:hypothetical protein